MINLLLTIPMPFHPLTGFHFVYNIILSGNSTLLSTQLLTGQFG